jgi:hypothetical protein
MPETTAPAVDFSADADLITFLKAIPDGRYRRGVRYPQWYLLLVAVLGILAAPRGTEPGAGSELRYAHRIGASVFSFLRTIVM